MRARQNLFILILIVYVCSLYSQDAIVVATHGISDYVAGKSLQEARDRAVLDAKRQAIERAGVCITAETQVKNYILISDSINSKAEGCILRGYQILDIGLLSDGHYHVALFGKVIPDQNIPKTPQELQIEILDMEIELRRIKEKYLDLGDMQDTKIHLARIIENKPGLVAQMAFYLIFYWRLYENGEEEYKKFAQAYPRTKYLKPARECIVADLSQRLLAIGDINYSSLVNAIISRSADNEYYFPLDSVQVEELGRENMKSIVNHKEADSLIKLWNIND